MLNYACKAGEACKAGNSYRPTATLWQRQQLIYVDNKYVGGSVLLHTDSKCC